MKDSMIRFVAYFHPALLLAMAALSFFVFFYREVAPQIVAQVGSLAAMEVRTFMIVAVASFAALLISVGLTAIQNFLSYIENRC